MPSVARYRIAVCRGPECAGKRAGDAVHERLARLIEEQGLHDTVCLDRHSCFGRCRVGPNVHVRELVATDDAQQFVFVAMPPRRRGRSALYSHVGEDDAGDILASHVLGGEIVHRLIHRPAPSAEGAPGDAPRLATAAPPSHASVDTDAGTHTEKASDAGD